jgi:hypothetical protein
VTEERLDPAGFARVQALSRRLPAQPEAVRRLLEARLQAAQAAHAQHCAEAKQAMDAQAEQLLARRPALAPEVRQLQAAGDAAGLRRLALKMETQGDGKPLARLNEAVRSAAAARAAQSAPAGGADPEELASARSFRRAWARERSAGQVDQALARGPANAGPLNSHALVLQSLALMRQLSPDYLQHFLAHVESLQWLEQAREKLPRERGTPPKPARRGRPGK